MTHSFIFELIKEQELIIKLLAGAESRRDVIIEDLEDYKDYTPIVRRLLLARDRETLAGINGVISDFLNIQPQLQSIIEILIEPYAEYVVVAREEDAVKAMAFLKENNHPSATFLIRDKLMPVSIPSSDRERLTKAKGFIGFATDFVSYEKQNDDIVSVLIGNVIIMESFQSARKLPVSIQRNYRIISVMGEQIQFGSVWTVGKYEDSKKGSIGCWKRQRVLQETLDTIEQYKTNLQDIQNRIKIEQNDEKL